MTLVKSDRLYHSLLASIWPVRSQNEQWPTSTWLKYSHGIVWIPLLFVDRNGVDLFALHMPPSDCGCGFVAQVNSVFLLSLIS